ncbi:MAG: hypothetical protein ACJ735_03945 [Actinomycetes bacterium]
MTAERLNHDPVVSTTAGSAVLYCDRCDETRPVNTDEPGWEAILNAYVREHVRRHGMVHVGLFTASDSL